MTSPSTSGLDQALSDAIADGSLSPTVDPNDPLTYPEDAQGLKDLIHGIHSSGLRTRAFQHVRGPTRQGYYDWSEVTFPGILTDCSTCHLPGTYVLDNMPAEGLLPTTRRTQNAVEEPLRADVLAARASLPNDEDLVNSPIASTCYYCHTSDVVIAHMEINGGAIG